MASEASNLSAVADFLACPACYGAVTLTPPAVVCSQCDLRYEINDGIFDFLGDGVPPQNSFYDDPRYRQMQRAMATMHREHYQDGSLSGWGEEAIKSDVRQLLQIDHPIVVDLGCGTGSGFHLFAEPTIIIGVDVNRDLLRMARARNSRAILIRADLNRLPFKTGWVPALLALAVLEHTFFLEATLAEISRVQRPDGYMYVSIPNEGRLGCTLVRRFLTAPKNARLSGLTVAEFMHAMKIEHCNSAEAIECQIKKYFSIEQRHAWPFRFGGRALNLALTYRLRPLK